MPKICTQHQAQYTERASPQRRHTRVAASELDPALTLGIQDGWHGARGRDDHRIVPAGWGLFRLISHSMTVCDGSDLGFGPSTAAAGGRSGRSCELRASQLLRGSPRDAAQEHDVAAVPTREA